MQTLLRAAALVASASGAPEGAPVVPARFPQFEWETVQTFIHGCQCDSVLLTEQQLDYVSRYRLAVVEKGHGSEAAGLLQGDRTIPALARQLKQRRPAMFVLFYQNPVLDFLLSDLHTLARAVSAPASDLSCLLPTPTAPRHLAETRDRALVGAGMM